MKEKKKTLENKLKRWKKYYRWSKLQIEATTNANLKLNQDLIDLKERMKNNLANNELQINDLKAENERLLKELEQCHKEEEHKTYKDPIKNQERKRKKDYSEQLDQLANQINSGGDGGH